MKNNQEAQSISVWKEKKVSYQIRTKFSPESLMVLSDGDILAGDDCGNIHVYSERGERKQNEKRKENEDEERKKKDDQELDILWESQQRPSGRDPRDPLGVLFMT